MAPGHAHDEKRRRTAALNTKKPKLPLPPLIANLDEMYDLDDLDFDESSSSDDEGSDEESESDITDDDNDDDATSASETEAAKEEDIDEAPKSDEDDDDDDDDAELNAQKQQRSSNYSINLNGQQEAMNVLLGIRRPEATS
jgi:hypothetical protein